MSCVNDCPNRWEDFCDAPACKTDSKWLMRSLELAAARCVLDNGIFSNFPPAEQAKLEQRLKADIKADKQHIVVALFFGTAIVRHKRSFR